MEQNLHVEPVAKSGSAANASSASSYLGRTVSCGIRASVVLVCVDRAARMICQIPDVFARGIETLVPPSSDGLHHGATLGVGELRAAIRGAVDALGPTDRRLYELCIDGDASYQEAAAVLGLSHGSIRNRVSRLRTRLRTTLSTIQEVYEK